MPYLGIWHMAYGRVLCGMWGIQALSGMNQPACEDQNNIALILTKLWPKPTFMPFPLNFDVNSQCKTGASEKRVA